jgi:hypothetical protein
LRGKKLTINDIRLIVRYLTQDHAHQSGKATGLFEPGLTEDEPCFIRVLAMVETAWVLERVEGVTLFRMPMRESQCARSAFRVMSPRPPSRPAMEISSSMASPVEAGAAELDAFALGRSRVQQARKPGQRHAQRPTIAQLNPHRVLVKSNCRRRNAHAILCCIGASESAGRPKSCFTRSGPGREIGHARQPV